MSLLLDFVYAVHIEVCIVQNILGSLGRYLSQPGHTFHHGQFWDLMRLIDEKEKQGLTVSLCIPTLNEEQTIGKELVLFKSELVDRYPLLDEIAVIDSGSTDRTLEVAARFGADVYLAADILPQLGAKRGKGENLWKAIYQLKGISSSTSTRTSRISSGSSPR